MLEILKKLQIKNLDDKKLIINAPFSYLELLNLDDIVFDSNVIQAEYDFIQIFGETLDELNEMSHKYIKNLKDDGLFWVCYPKKSSKKIISDCSRDNVAILLEDVNYRPVRQIAVNEDYSALRFREKSKVINK